MKLLKLLLIESTTIQTPTYIARILFDGGIFIEIKSKKSTLAGFLMLENVTTTYDSLDYEESLSEVIEFDANYSISLDGMHNNYDFVKDGMIAFEASIEEEDEATPDEHISRTYQYWGGVNRVKFYKNAHVEFLNILNKHGMKINGNDLNGILMEFGDKIIEYVQS